VSRRRFRQDDTEPAEKPVPVEAASVPSPPSGPPGGAPVEIAPSEPSTGAEDKEAEVVAASVTVEAVPDPPTELKEEAAPAPQVEAPPVDGSENDSPAEDGVILPDVQPPAPSEPSTGAEDSMDEGDENSSRPIWIDRVAKKEAERSQVLYARPGSYLAKRYPNAGAKPRKDWERKGHNTRRLIALGVLLIAPPPAPKEETPPPAE
jgi:hypothetical protein